MKLQFEANQPFQLEAISAVTRLFDGQPHASAPYTNLLTTNWFGLYQGQTQNELGLANHLAITPDQLLANTRAVQLHNDIDTADPDLPLETWELTDPTTGETRPCPHFSVEMETGTGKTYVYLRTIFELSQQYGWQKFIIVVPSVAIREGVLKNIEITAEHFRDLYNIPVEHFVYDGKRINRLRQFATSNTLQILIINIDAFRKNFTGTDEERKSNVIYKQER